MRKAEILTALGFIAFAIAVILQALQVGVVLVNGQPRAGVFPFWLALLLGLCGIVLLGQLILGGKGHTGLFFRDRTALVSFLKVSLSGAVMLAFTYLVGFYTAAIIYMFIYTRFIGRHRWPAVIVMSLLIPFGTYFLFEQVLEILLPRGIFSVLPFLE